MDFIGNQGILFGEYFLVRAKPKKYFYEWLKKKSLQQSKSAKETEWRFPRVTFVGIDV